MRYRMKVTIWGAALVWVVVSCVPLAVCLFYSWNDIRVHEVKEKAPRYLRGWPRGIRSEQFLPPEAKSLEYNLSSGFGTFLDWKCQVGEQDFLRFTRCKKWELHEEVPSSGRLSWLQSYGNGALPSSLYYVFVPSASSGGLNVLFDRSTGMMYGSYSSR